MCDESTAGFDSDAKLYGTLMAHYLHQNGLLWSRVQTALAIETAVLAAAYKLNHGNPWAAFATLELGTVFILALAWIIDRDERCRDVNREVMDHLAQRLSRGVLPIPRLRAEVESRIQRGGFLVRAGIWLLIVINLALVSWYMSVGIKPLPIVVG
jgi:hypothetical protein